KLEFPLLLMAIAITVWHGGLRPGLLAVVLAGVGFDYFFTEPLYTLYIEPADRPIFVAFLAFALVIALFGARRRRIERELRDARAALEREVAERTQQASLLYLTHDTIFVRGLTGWTGGGQGASGSEPQRARGPRRPGLRQPVPPPPAGQDPAQAAAHWPLGRRPRQAPSRWNTGVRIQPLVSASRRAAAAGRDS